MTETTNPTTIAQAVEAMPEDLRNKAIRSINAYGETSPIRDEDVALIVGQIQDYAAGLTVGLSIAAAGAVRTEAAAAGLPTKFWAVSNGRAAASIDETPGFPPITGKEDRIRFFTDQDEAKAMANRLNDIPNVRGGFKVIAF